MEDNKLKFRASKDKLSPTIMEKLKRDKEVDYFMHPHTQYR